MRPRPIGAQKKWTQEVIDGSSFIYFAFLFAFDPCCSLQRWTKLIFWSHSARIDGCFSIGGSWSQNNTCCAGLNHLPMSQKNRPGLSVPQEPDGEVRIARLIEDLAELVSEIAKICWHFHCAFTWIHFTWPLVIWDSYRQSHIYIDLWYNLWFTHETTLNNRYFSRTCPVGVPCLWNFQHQHWCLHERVHHCYQIWIIPCSDRSSWQEDSVTGKKHMPVNL